MMEYANKMLLTEIDDSCDADVYFPSFSLDDWNREVIGEHQYEDINYSHVVYTRKKKK